MIRGNKAALDDGRGLILEIKNALEQAEALVSSLRRLLDLSVPTTPQNVSAAVNGSFATLTWDDSEGARRISHYAIYRNGNFVTTDTNSPYEESGLGNGAHIYQVAAVDTQGVEGSKGTAAAVTVSVVPPNPDVPISFLASAASATGINLSWARGPIDPAPTDYGLDYATAGASGPWTPIDIALVTSYNHTALTTATQYWYRLAAFNSVTPSNGYATATETTDNAGAIPAANFIIPNTVQSWDGAVAHAPEDGSANRPVRAGDVIQFASGTYDVFTLSNIVGSLNNRITVRGPQTGRATFRRSSPGGSGFVFRLDNCRHVNFNGSTTDTGITAGPDGIRRCIRVMYATGASAGNKDNPSGYIKFRETSTATYTATRNITISYVEVDGGYPTVAGNGAGISTNTDSNALLQGWSKSPYVQGSFQEHIILEYNYLHNLYQEAVYCGPNVYHWTRTGHTPEVPLRYIKIRHNYVADTGSDGLLFKSVFGGTPGADGTTENSCHHNVIIRPGQNPNSSGVVGGIGIATSSAKIDIFNNWIETAGAAGIRYSVSEGTGTGDANGAGTYIGKIYNNVIISAGTLDTGANGIHSRMDTSGSAPPASFAPTALSYNNTIISGANYGIFYNSNISSNSWARNNICLNNAVGQISNGPGGSSNNLTAGALSTIFVDPVGTYEGANINLRPSAAQLAVGTPGTDIALTDYTDAIRVGADKGAYEAV